jgi:hypothetical protein
MSSSKVVGGNMFAGKSMVTNVTKLDTKNKEKEVFLRKIR